MPDPQKESACESACAGKTADSPCKKPPKDTDNNDDCWLNCPLCYVMTVPGVATLARSFGIVEKEYPLYQSSYIFIYSSIAWKPPDAC